MTLPINRTALIAAQTNQIPNMVLQSALNIAAIQTPYDTIDELNLKVDANHAAGNTGSTQLADGSVITQKIAPQAVTSSRIANNAVGAAQLDPTLLTDYGDIAVQAEFDRRGIDIMKYVVADGVTDDTAGFRLAGAAAIASRTALLIPSNIRILVTDTLEFNEAFAILGIGLEQGNGGSASAKGSIIVFSNSEVDGSLNATKCLFRFKKTTAYYLNGMRIENIGIVHTSSVKNQQSIIIDAADFSYSHLNNLHFNGCTGYAIQFSGATYSQNMNWSNIGFINVGGCIGRSSTAPTLSVTMANFSNFNLDGGINIISPQPIIYDFSGMRHYSMDTLLCEGALTGISADITGLKMGTTYAGTTTATYKNVWFEFSSIKQLTYSIETITGGYFQMESVKGITSSSPIKLGGNATTLIIRGMDAFGETASSMVAYTSATAKLIFEGVQFTGMQTQPNGKIGILEMKNCISYGGTNQTRFSSPSSGVLYDYKGGLTEDNKFVTVRKAGSFHVSTVKMRTDGSEGRCLHYTNASSNDIPEFGMTINVPSELYGCSITVGYRYYIATTDVTSVVQALYSPSTDPSSRANYINIKNTWTSGHMIFRNVSGNLQLYTVTSGTITASHDIYIADVKVMIGDEMPVMLGKIGATQTIRYKATAIPTIGDYIVGDIVDYTVPAASGKIGAVCTTAGSPGTWKPFGAIDA